MPRLNLEKSVEPTVIAQSTESTRLFWIFRTYRMGDTISSQISRKTLYLQHFEQSRYDSTDFSRFKESHMKKIITPDQFKNIPWKNGKGTTTELAISKNGTLENFDWRISIASVSEDGEFSDFSGYWRKLILISGNGIRLVHDENKIDELSDILSIASFSGNSKTVGKLCDGTIFDFNVMTDMNHFKADINTYTQECSVELNSAEFCFIYSLEKEFHLYETDNFQLEHIDAGSLLRLENIKEKEFVIRGGNLIVIFLSKLIK